MVCLLLPSTHTILEGMDGLHFIVCFVYFCWSKRIGPAKDGMEVHWVEWNELNVFMAFYGSDTFTLLDCME